MEEEMVQQQQQQQQQQMHFVLVHGACHGGWSWYKLKPRLEAAGHRVTALDLSASGVDTKKIHELRTLHDYSKPLMEIMETINDDEKVILVGHSLGGLSLALAMDRYPRKISLAAFVSAFMPDSTHAPSHVLDEYNARTPAESWLDTQFSPVGTLDEPLTSMFFGPKFVSSKLYQLSSIEDLALATALIRPSSLFLEDLSKANKFSKEGYESVKRVYIVCDKDLAIPMEFQHWMIENSPVAEVMEINGADHMPMCSKPQQLCHCLLEMANKHVS